MRLSKNTKELFLVLLASFNVVIIGCTPTRVLFGDKTEKADFFKMPNGKDSLAVIRVFIDKEGLIYPQGKTIERYLIENENTFLVNKYGNFKNLKSFNENNSIKELYGKYEGSQDLTYNGIMDFTQKFNTETSKPIVEKINALVQKENYKNVTFIMTGFNNTYTNKENSINSSEAKIKFQRDRIAELLHLHNLSNTSNLKKTIFVEVHWDGTYTSRKGLKTAISYNNGLISSYKAGLALRRILNQIDNKDLEITMISHSSGANVICESLFNQSRKIRAYKKNTAGLFEYLNDCYERKDPYYNTPSNSKINLFLMEASLPGIETFADYYKRQPTKLFNYKAELLSIDNYYLNLGYNINDPDLRKKFGKGLVGKMLNKVNYNDRLIKAMGNSFGATQFGCNEDEILRVERLFKQNYDINQFKKYNFSFSEINGYKSPNYFHDVTFYLNLELYTKAISEIFGLTIN